MLGREGREGVLGLGLGIVDREEVEAVAVEEVVGVGTSEAVEEGWARWMMLGGRSVGAVARSRCA